MNDKNTGLETFVEHHRADFDVFEPRPDLWDDIALDLGMTGAGAETEAAPLRVVPLFPTASAGLPPVAAPDTAAVRSARPYGVAAAVATLLLLGTWFWQHRTEATIWTRTGQPAVAQAPARLLYPARASGYPGRRWPRAAPGQCRAAHGGLLRRPADGAAAGVARK